MKASIIVNGSTKGTLLITGDYIIAVDGGANELRRRGIIPDVIVGDLDSISQSTLNYFKDKGVKVVTYPHEKDETDLELALVYAFENGAENVEILNWQGERLDMILAMVGLISRFDNVVAISEICELGVLRAGEHTLKALVGEVWSILPLCRARLRLEGFKYQFDGEMDLEKPIGVSNVSTTETVRISVQDGKVVYIRWKRKPL